MYPARCRWTAGVYCSVGALRQLQLQRLTVAPELIQWANLAGISVLNASIRATSWRRSYA